MRTLFKSLSKFLVAFGLASLLAACGPIYQTHYTYQPPVSWRGRQCVNQCLSQKSFCESACQSAYQRCTIREDRIAAREYRAYVREQNRMHKPVTKSPGEFGDYSACSRSCSCDTNYRQCYSNCGGQVIPHRKCVAFCKKKRPQTASVQS